MGFSRTIFKSTHVLGKWPE